MGLLVILCNTSPECDFFSPYLKIIKRNIRAVNIALRTARGGVVLSSHQNCRKNLYLITGTDEKKDEISTLFLASC